MLKREFAFAVSLFAVMSVGNAYATTPSGTEAVSEAHTVYTAASNAGASGAATDIASGIAGVTYVNRMVNLAGNAAQKAEDHAAAAGASAIVAKQAADDAANEAAKVANKFDKKFTTDATKKAIVTTDKDGNVLPVKISDPGTGTYITGVSVSDAGAVTLTRGTPASYSLPTASSSTKGGVKIGANVNVATDGKISVNTTDTPTKDSTVPLTSGGAFTALDAKEAVANKVQVDAGGSLTEAQKGSTTMYPSMATASKMISDANVAIDQQLQQITNEDEGILAQAKGYTTTQLNALDLGTVSATGKAIVSVTQSDGIVAATTGEIGTAGIAAGAVTVAKTTGLYGVIPSGSQGNTSASAYIWVE